MKFKVVTLSAALLSSLALVSCSQPKSVAGDYIKKQNAGNLEGADSEDAGSFEGDELPEGDEEVETPASTPTPTPGTPAPATPTPGTPAPATPTPGTPAPATPTPGTPAPATPTPMTPQTQTPAATTYADIQSKILAPSCIACHKTGNAMGGVNIDTYARVKSAANSIKNHAVTGSDMPPTGPLSADLKKLLGDWIAAGSPEK